MLVQPSEGGTDAARDAGVTVTEAAQEFGGAGAGPDMQTLLAGGALLAGLAGAYVVRGGL